MTREQTAQNNKLIAEFMGKTLITANEFDNMGVHSCTGKHEHTKWGIIEYLHYHTNWMELMPVVERINSFTNPDNEDVFLYTVTITPARCRIVTNEGVVIVDNEHGSAMIEVVYLAVVEFINWYNEQDK